MLRLTRAGHISRRAESAARDAQSARGLTYTALLVSDTEAAAVSGNGLKRELTAILRTLRGHKMTLQSAETSSADLEALLDGQFSETGASGRHYGRDAALQKLARRSKAEAGAEAPEQMSELRCRQLATDLYLLTYRLRQSGRLTRRASIWRRTGRTWRILYHQGTVVSEAAAPD